MTTKLLLDMSSKIHCNKEGSAGRCTSAIIGIVPLLDEKTTLYSTAAHGVSTPRATCCTPAMSVSVDATLDSRENARYEVDTGKLAGHL